MSESENEPHEVVKLLIARMESHPEEFQRGMYRWYDTISNITEFGNEADKAALNAGLRKIRLDEAHEVALDELLNGPERRAEAEREKLEIERVRMQSLQQQMAAQKYSQAQQQQHLYSQGALSSQLAGLSPTGFTPGLRGTSLTSIGTAINNANALQLGNEKLDEGILKKLKKAAGL